MFGLSEVPIGWFPNDGTYKRSPTERCCRTKFGQCSELYSTDFNFIPIQKNGSCPSMNSVLTQRVRRCRERRAAKLRLTCGSEWFDSTYEGYGGYLCRPAFVRL